MSGGPNSTQKQAKQIELQNATQQQSLAKDNAAKFGALYGQTQPFYANEMQQGLPFYGSLVDQAAGNTAQAFAPAKGAFLRRTASLGSLPSGFREAGLQDIEQNQARAFDQGLGAAQFANFGAKQQGAAGLAGLMGMTDPSRFYGGSSQSAQAATQPLQAAQNPWMGVLGAAAGGAASALPW